MMKLCIVLLVILCWYFQARVVCIPLQQFLPFGPTAGDERTTFIGDFYDPYDDGTSRPLPLSPPYPIIGRQGTSLHVNVNGVVSMQRPFHDYTPQPFPYTNGIIICPFWDDVRINHAGSIYHNNGHADRHTKSRVSLLVQEKLRFNFDPTGVFIATWNAVSYHDADSNTNLGNNTFQCVLATNGQDTFVLFLYADGLIQWTQGCTSCGGYTQVGVDGGDGVNYYSVPNSLTPEIINITHTSNVNTPGLWILKVDSTIIAGLPSAPSDLVVVETGATEITLGWTHNSTNAAESFTINCTAVTSQNTITTVIADPRPTGLNDSESDQGSAMAMENNTFVYTVAQLEENSSYMCIITARNIFGWSPISETIEVMTNPTGPPEDITGPFSNRTTEPTAKSTTTIRTALNIGVVGGAGGAAVLLLILITATVVALCVVMNKRKKENKNVVSTTKEEDINIYDEVSQTPNIELKPPATQPMPSQTVKFKVQTPNHYTVNLHQPQLPKSQKGAKKPMMPPNKPRSASSAGSKQTGFSDGIYMALNPVTMAGFQPSQDTEYMPLSAATRKGGAQGIEAPQYVNCQTALENRYRPTKTAKL